MSRQRTAATGRAALLPGFVVVTIGSAACATLLGIGDRTLDPELGDGEVVPIDAASEAQLDGGVDAVVDAQVDTAVDTGTAIDAGTEAGFCTASSMGPCLMASGLNVPYSVVSDSSRVYWTESGYDMDPNGAVKSCPVSGCGAGPLVYASGVGPTRGVAIDAQNVYWGNPSEAGIFSCPLAGCVGLPTQLAPASDPGCVAVGATEVYWTDMTDGTVYHVPKSSGAATAMQLFDAGMGLNSPYRCAVDGSSLYVMDSLAGVYRVPLSGGDPIVVVQPSASLAGAWPIALDPSTIYFSTGAGIARIPKTVVDASAGIPIVSNLTSPFGVLFDPPTSDVYWTDRGFAEGSSGLLGKVSADGSIAVLSGGLPRPTELTVTGGTVFWLSETAFDSQGNFVSNTGALWRQAK
jgi:hypothetical protein